MKNKVKQLMRKFFFWIFKNQLEELELQIKVCKNTQSNLNLRLDRIKQIESKFINVLKNIDISVDVHEYQYSPSWAVISLQGQKSDYIKFVDLGSSGIREISEFLRKYERSYNIKVDASPNASQFLRIKKHNL